MIQTIKNSNSIIEGISTADDDKINPAEANSAQLLRHLLKKYNVPKLNSSLPLILFINARLYHGDTLIDSSQSSLMYVKDSIELKNLEFSFKHHTIDWMPLESRVTIEISSLYNTTYLHKLGIVSFSIFDGFGVMNTGTRVDLNSSRNSRSGD